MINPGKPELNPVWSMRIMNSCPACWLPGGYDVGYLHWESPADDLVAQLISWLISGWTSNSNGGHGMTPMEVSPA